MANKCKYKNSGNAESLPTGHPNDLKHFHDKVLSSFITLKAQHFYFLLFWLRNKSSKIPFRLPRRESWLANMGWRTIMQKWHLIQNHRCDKLKVLTVNPLLSPPPPPPPKKPPPVAGFTKGKPIRLSRPVQKLYPLKFRSEGEGIQALIERNRNTEIPTRSRPS